jgi:uncharacterized protein (TIGR02217 family)
MDNVILDFIKWFEKDPVEKTFEWKTDVVEYDNKNNQRNQVWSAPRRHWFVNLAFMKKKARDRVIEFFNRAKGRGNSFLYKDEDDYSAVCDLVGDGATQIFQLEKVYYPISDDFSEIGWAEDKEDIKSGSIAVTSGGAPLVSGWAVDCATGLITFTNAPSSGSAVLVSFDFYFRVIFATDTYKDTKLYPSNVRYESEILEPVEV